MDMFFHAHFLFLLYPEQMTVIKMLVVKLLFLVSYIFSYQSHSNNNINPKHSGYVGFCFHTTTFSPITDERTD